MGIVAKGSSLSILMLINLTPASKWHLRELREADLPILAQWTASALPTTPINLHDDELNVLKALRLQYKERRRVFWPHEYLGLLDDCPIFTIYGYLTADQSQGARKRISLCYQLSMTMNLSLPLVDLFWEPAWHLSLRHFFDLPQVSQIITMLDPSNTGEQQAIVRLGFQASAKSTDSLRAYCYRKSDFLALTSI